MTMTVQETQEQFADLAAAALLASREKAARAKERTERMERLLHDAEEGQMDMQAFWRVVIELLDEEAGYPLTRPQTRH